jgi:predicted ester cyclase
MALISQAIRRSASAAMVGRVHVHRRFGSILVLAFSMLKGFFKMKYRPLSIASFLLASTTLLGIGQAQALTIEEARLLAEKLYAVLNKPGEKDVQPLYAANVTADFKTYGANDSFNTVKQAALGLAGMGKAVPNLKWEIKDFILSGDQMIVRGEGSGMPVLPFLGIPPTGKSFKVMSIDIWTIKEGKASSVYHVEDMLSAIGQLTAPQ